MRISAPSARIPSTLFAGTSRDMQTTQRTPASRAACASARPWLPVEAATTPLARTASGRARSALVAPRSLKLPVA